MAIGHVARMPDHRLPKQMMFAFLPPSIGTVRQPGRRWLQMEYVSHLPSNGTPLATWFHTARNSLHWRPLLSFTHYGLEGDRTHQYPVLLPETFPGRADQCAAELLYCTEVNSWIRLETDLGGRAKVHERQTQCFTLHHPENDIGEYCWMSPLGCMPRKP